MKYIPVVTIPNTDGSAVTVTADALASGTGEVPVWTQWQTGTRLRSSFCSLKLSLHVVQRAASKAQNPFVTPEIPSTEEEKVGESQFISKQKIWAICFSTHPTGLISWHQRVQSLAQRVPHRMNAQEPQQTRPCSCFAGASSTLTGHRHQPRSSASKDGNSVRAV